MKPENKYEQLEALNIKNIAGKVAAGKTLTAADRRAVENHRRKELGLRPMKTEQELAKEFGVGRRGSIVRWKKLEAPFGGTNEQVYQWMLDNNIRGADEWKKKYRNENPGKFKTKNTKKENAKILRVETKTAEELRDEYLADLRLAKEACDESREKMALNAYLKIEKQIREREAHEKKLGIERGEMLARAEVERILRTLFHSANACCDKFSKQIAQRLSNLEAAEVYEILAPQLTSLTIFESLQKAANPPGECNLPQWVIDTAKTEEKHYIEYD